MAVEEFRGEAWLLEILHEAWLKTGLSVEQLRTRYVLAGGDKVVGTIENYVGKKTLGPGKTVPAPWDWNRLAVVINEALREKGFPPEDDLKKWALLGEGETDSIFVTKVA